MNTRLIKIVLAESNVAMLQAFALVLFMLFFAAIIFWITRPGAKKYYETIARDLLQGDANER